MSEKFLNPERTAELWGKVKEYVGEHSGGSAGGGVPIGAIVIWSGTADNIPAGWALCDGEDGRPDLRDKFVLGAGENHPVGETGGSETVTLTVAQMPSHSHIQRQPSSDRSSNLENQTYGSNSVSSHYSHPLSQTIYGNFNITTASAGSSNPHPNMPPYYALCYIIKVTADATDGSTGGGPVYNFGHGLKQNGPNVSVDTVDDFDGDNTLPMTAAGVQATVGNIGALLGTI